MTVNTYIHRKFTEIICYAFDMFNLPSDCVYMLSLTHAQLEIVIHIHGIHTVSCCGYVPSNQPKIRKQQTAIKTYGSERETRRTIV